jgi:hypothetical protein
MMTAMAVLPAGDSPPLPLDGFDVVVGTGTAVFWDVFVLCDEGGAVVGVIDVCCVGGGACVIVEVMNDVDGGGVGAVVIDVVGGVVVGVVTGGVVVGVVTGGVVVGGVGVGVVVGVVTGGVVVVPGTEDILRYLMTLSQAQAQSCQTECQFEDTVMNVQLWITKGKKC